MPCVLIVDDDADTREMWTVSMSPLECDTMTARHGPLAEIAAGCGTPNLSGTRDAS